MTASRSAAFARLALVILLLLLAGCATSGLVTSRDEATRQGGQAETKKPARMAGAEKPIL